jgi:hypothetical protein
LAFNKLCLCLELSFCERCVVPVGGMAMTSCLAGAGCLAGLMANVFGLAATGALAVIDAWFAGAGWLLSWLLD